MGIAALDHEQRRLVAWTSKLGTYPGTSGRTSLLPHLEMKPIRRD